MFKSYKLLHKTRMVLFTKGFNIPHPDIAYNVRYIKNPSLLYWTITYFIFLFFIFLCIWVFSRPMVKFEAIANKCLLHFLKKRLWTQPYDSHRVVIYKETPLGPSLRTRLKKKTQVLWTTNVNAASSQTPEITTCGLSLLNANTWRILLGDYAPALEF